MLIQDSTLPWITHFIGVKILHVQNLCITLVLWSKYIYFKFTFYIHIWPTQASTTMYSSRHHTVPNYTLHRRRKKKLWVIKPPGYIFYPHLHYFSCVLVILTLHLQPCTVPGITPSWTTHFIDFPDTLTFEHLSIATAVHGITPS